MKRPLVIACWLNFLVCWDLGTRTYTMVDAWVAVTGTDL